MPDHLFDLTDPAHPARTDLPLSEAPPQQFAHSVLQQEPLEELDTEFGLPVVAFASGTTDSVSMEGSEDLQVLHEGEVLQRFSEIG